MNSHPDLPFLHQAWFIPHVIDGARNVSCAVSSAAGDGTGSLNVGGRVYPLKESGHIGDLIYDHLHLHEEAFRAGAVSDLKTSDELATLVHAVRVYEFVANDLRSSMMEPAADARRKKEINRLSGCHEDINFDFQHFWKLALDITDGADIDVFTNTLMMMGRVYELTTTQDGVWREIKVVINGQRFFPKIKSLPLKQYQHKMHRALHDLIKKRMEDIQITQNHIRARRRLQDIMHQLGIPLNLAHSREHILYQNELLGMGVMIYHNIPHAFIDISAHLIESRRDPGKIYRFDSTRLMLSLISTDPAEILAPKRLFVLSPRYEHPFVESRSGVLCMQKEPSYYAGLRNLGLAQGIVKLLADGESTMLGGYKHSKVPYHEVWEFPRRLDASGSTP